MSAAVQTRAPTTEPSRSGRLLDLVRKLIDYGRELAATIRRTPINPTLASIRFGTTELALILASITRGLHLASALEARVLRSAAHLDAGSAPGRTRSASKAAATPPAEVDPRLARLPTPEQIAAAVRRRPIGAVIGDICRDLGITASHPLWRDVQSAMMEHSASLADLAMDIIDRAVFPVAEPPTAVTPAALRPPILPFEAPGSTGPP